MKNIKENYGPWALITGASSGIGREFAIRLASLGLNLILVARREDKLIETERLAKNISPQVDVKVIVADLTTDAGVNYLKDETLFFEVGLLVNNAGREDSGNFFDISLEDSLATLKLNCQVPLELTYHFGEKMQQRKKGGIVFMSSLVAHQGVPYVANYAGTKAYNLIFSESIRAEFGKYNIDILAATPGFTDTELAHDWNFSGMPMKPLKADFVAKKIIQKLGKKTIVIPGFINKILYFTGKYLQPRWLNTFSFGTVFKKVLRSKINKQLKGN